MSAGRLVVVIRGDEIVVTQPGSNFSAVYYKPRGTELGWVDSGSFLTT
jgi:hypothetical protein